MSSELRKGNESNKPTFWERCSRLFKRERSPDELARQARQRSIDEYDRTRGSEPRPWEVMYSNLSESDKARFDMIFQEDYCMGRDLSEYRLVSIIESLHAESDESKSE